MPAPDPIETRPNRFDSFRPWLMLGLILLTIGAIAGAIAAHRFYETGRRFGALSQQYQVWADALWRYEPTEPDHKDYVRHLSVYYRQVSRNYAAAQWQPWLEVGPFIEPPERPATLPGKPDPRTGVPPEVGEAIANLQGSVAANDPLAPDR